ncbi:MULTISPECIES: thioredoxin family protein [Pseudomonas]|uniref:Thioredoxin n=1 Tax=Pseudomonas kribbensis TaxID=1628086 RepID=A0A4Y8VI72_9PSED|nr:MULTISPECIES: thioredoxin family protein [Pseudomonas]TFH80145.1 thioredoxin [Pseudomonas kribbensis]
MRSTSEYSTLAPAYRKALKTRRLVALYFYSEQCPACHWASPVFRRIAEGFKPWADSYMLDVDKSPRHARVSGFPTILLYRNGKLLEHFKGIGDEEMLEQSFVRYIGKIKPAPVQHKPKHDTAWLYQTLRNLCTLPRTSPRNFS